MSGAWLDKELFKIGEFSVTRKTAVISTSTLVIIIIITVAICMAISWWKRK